MDAFPQDGVSAKDGRLRLLLVEHNETDARLLLNLMRNGVVTGY